MKTKKRFLSILLSLVMVLGGIPGIHPYSNQRRNLNHNLPRREDDESRPCCAENTHIFKDYGLIGADYEEVFAPGRVGSWV